MHPEKVLKNLQHCLLQGSRIEDQLLMGVLPRIVKLILELSSHISQSSFFMKSFIQRQIFADVLALARPILLRILVLEMHLSRMSGLLTRETTEQRFQQFVELLTDDNFFEQILDKYPLLKIQLEKKIAYYRVALDELLSRIVLQTRPIADHLFKKKVKQRKLLAIQFSGDQHKQGRSVAILKFSGGEKILYKPRSLAVDVAFQKLLIWFNQKLLSNKLRTQKFVTADDYGFCEFIEYKSCQTEKQIQNYYYRFGLLLALTHLLRVSDLHFENLIACGDCPMLIDYECLLKPVIATEKKAIPNFYVTQTGLLPARIFANESRAGFEASALAMASKQAAVYRSMTWLEAGTDQMKLARIEATIPMRKNLPKLKAKKIPYQKYATHISKGFQMGYEVLLKNLKQLKRKSSPLQAFSQTQIRVLIRPTNEYAKLLIESFHPSLLVDPLKRRSYFEWLKLRYKHMPYFDHMIQSEIRDLLEGDIPGFYTKVNSKQIFDSHGLQNDIPVTHSGWDLLQHQLTQQFSRKDLQQQHRLLEMSLVADSYQGKHSHLKKLMNGKKKATEKELRQQLMHVTKMQLDALIIEAIEDQAGLIWPLIIRVGLDNHAILKFTDWQLYNGMSGIALAFAYGAEVFSEQKYLQVAKHCYHSLKELIQKHSLSALTESSGVFNGASSLLFSLLHFYKLWRLPEIKSLLQQLLKQLPALIKSDVTLDIIGGNAGCLMTLIRLQGAFPKWNLLPLMQLCVDRILEIYPTPAILPQNKPIIAIKQPLLGFSHGTSGLLWALAWFYELQQQPVVKNWIEQALLYERKYFDEQQQNWPDYREHVAGKSTVAWCHGAMGIGLSRLDLPQRWQDELVQKEIDVAIETTLQQGYLSNFNVCHGCLGNLEIILQQSPKEIFYQHGALLTNILQTLSSNTAKM